jgi:hypothetical protein
MRLIRAVAGRTRQRAGEKMTTKQKTFLVCILMLSIGLSGCAAKVEGIDTPIEVGDIQLQVTSATTQDTYYTGDQRMDPASAADTILVVEASVSAAPDDLLVSVTDENGRTDSPSVRQTRTMSDEITMTWLFGVSKTAQSFTLNLPSEIAIPLDSLLK